MHMHNLGFDCQGLYFKEASTLREVISNKHIVSHRTRWRARLPPLHHPLFPHSQPPLFLISWMILMSDHLGCFAFFSSSWAFTFWLLCFTFTNKEWAQVILGPHRQPQQKWKPGPTCTLVLPHSPLTSLFYCVPCNFQDLWGIILFLLPSFLMVIAEGILLSYSEPQGLVRLWYWLSIGWDQDTTKWNFLKKNKQVFYCYLHSFTSHFLCKLLQTDLILKHSNEVTFLKTTNEMNVVKSSCDLSVQILLMPLEHLIHNVTFFSMTYFLSNFCEAIFLSFLFYPCNWLWFSSFIAVTFLLSSLYFLGKHLRRTLVNE